MSDTADRNTGGQPPDLFVSPLKLPANGWISVPVKQIEENELSRSSTSFSNFYLYRQSAKVRRDKLRPLHALGLGIIACFLFAILVMVGVLLMAYRAVFWSDLEKPIDSSK